jgi:hypothetical protein
MAELVLRLRVDPVTGRREVVIDYSSDSDALPIEHEEEHRRLAGKVVDGGLGNERVVVSRETEAPATEAPGEAAAPVAQPTPSKR